MRRRALLASLGALAGVGTAGCTGGAGTGTRPDPTPADRYRITDLSVSTRYDRPDHRYVLSPREFASADAIERMREQRAVAVMDVAEIESPAVREALRTAVSSGEWHSNTLPDGLADLVDRVDFFTGLDAKEAYVGFELYRFDPDEPAVIEFSASVVEPTVEADSPGVLEFALTNRSNQSQTVFSGTVPPFGMLWADHDASDRRFLLWRDYENEGCVTFTDDGVAVCAIGILTEIQPGETLRRDYEVLPASTDHYPERTVPETMGRYNVSGRISYQQKMGAPGTSLAYDVGFTLKA